MKRLFLTIALVFSLGSSISAAAQENNATPDLYPGVEGIQSSYARFFTAMPDAMPIINILGMTFDSDENAKVFHESLIEESRTEIDETELPPGAKSEYTERDTGNDNVQVTRMSALGGDDGYAMVFDFIRDADTTFVVFVVATSDEEAVSHTDSVTRFILESDIENETVSFSEDGTSTGGVFDRMPTADDDIVPDGADVVDYEEIRAGDRT